MRRLNALFTCLCLLNISCKSPSKMAQKKLIDQIEVQGHRGDRGNFPENTVPGFISAVRKGVDVLELDVVISKDNKVVVSHEPFMSSEYMLTPTGNRISKNEEKSYNLYQMDYDSIRSFDAGTGVNVKFPFQKKIRTHKPLLKEVIDTVENYTYSHELPKVSYNIEIKSRAEEYGIYQPFPEEFVELVMKVITEKEIGKRVIIQSFDPRPLNILRRKYPEIKIAFLVESGSLQENLSELDFKPEIYSPHFSLLKDEAEVKSIKAAGMQVVPWTVNEKEEIARMIDLKVDAIISDYPERVLELLKNASEE